jgi:hypothetical protein
MSDGLELAIKRAGRWWRIYTVAESERFGRYATVLRNDAGEIINLPDELTARDVIMAMPDAVEVDYPA